MPLRRASRFAVVASLTLASCFSSVGKWTYPSGRYAASTSPQPAKAFVLVEPFLDNRGTENVSSMPWSYVPLFPLGWSHFDRPEAVVHGADTTSWVAQPEVDLARAVVIELRRGNLVERAEFAGDFGRGRGETHVLRGTLRAYFVAETRWTYGLSIYAYVMWALAFPVGNSENGFCVDLELVEAAGGRVVWSTTIFDADSWTEGYYYGPDWYRFPWLWERRLREQIGELTRALGGEPAPLPDALRDELALTPPTMPPRLVPEPAPQ